MQAFRVDDVLSTSLRVWRRNLVPFTVLALVIYSPNMAMRYFAIDYDVALAMIPLAIFLNTLLATALTYGVVMEVYGTRPSLRTCIVTGFAQLLPVVGVVFVAALGIAVGLIPLVTPGILFILSWYVMVPVAIIERPGVMASLKRSKQLTADFRSPLIALTMISFGAPPMLHNIARSTLDGIDWQVVATLIDVTAGSFSVVITAVAYARLRQVKEGTQSPEIASAFARFTA